MKLSKAQLDLLTHAIACGKATCAEYYPPRRKLVALGFVTEHEGKYSDWIEPTESGCKHLREMIEAEKQP